MAATRLDKPIRRERLHDGALHTVTFSADGVKVVEKGKRKGRQLSWSRVISGDAELTEALRISIDATQREFSRTARSRAASSTSRQRGWSRCRSWREEIRARRCAIVGACAFTTRPAPGFP